MKLALDELRSVLMLASELHFRKLRSVFHTPAGEVICRPPSTEHLGRMATLFRIPREQFLPIYVASRNPYDSGDVSAEEYWRQFAKSAGVEVNDSMVEKLRDWDLRDVEFDQFENGRVAGGDSLRGIQNRTVVQHAVRYGESCSKTL